MTRRRAILVIDDDNDVRELLKAALMADGYDVATAADGRDALHYLRSHDAPSVIVLDLMLPDMDGAHFRAAQLRDRSLAWIPVVAISGVVGGREQVRGFGVDQFVQKPLDLDEVFTRIRSAIAKSPARPRRAS